VRLRLGLSIACIVAFAAFMQACSRPLPPQAACNFVQNPDLQRVSWKKHLPVSLYIHSSVPVEAYPAIDRAIAHYNATLGGGTEVFRVMGRAQSGDLNPVRDGYSMIYWFKTWDPKKPTEQARTTIYWSGSEIFEFDMRINAYNFNYYFGEDTNFSDVDLDSLVLHELGHALGLAHNPTKGSVMNVTLDQAQVRRKLGAVDLASLKCEY
jgi:hypothetical protein